VNGTRFQKIYNHPDLLKSLMRQGPSSKNLMGFPATRANAWVVRQSTVLFLLLSIRQECDGTGIREHVFRRNL
jgi:hypothetical protein